MSCCDHRVEPYTPNTKQILYWIRRYGEFDPYTQGYIGITQRRLSHRVKQHKDALTNAGQILLAGGLVSVLQEAYSRTEICHYERHYRPETNIADNIAKGDKPKPIRYWDPNHTWISCIVCQREFTRKTSYSNHANSFHMNPTTIELQYRVK